jgi:F0F1-type ATP synthase assembly protein I
MNPTTASTSMVNEAAAGGGPEIASVLLVVQASLSLVAGLSALPFAIIEPGMRVLGPLTIALAIFMFVLARGIRRYRRWARRWVIALEAASLVITLLLTLLPLGVMRGPVPLLVNIALPTSILWLLRRRSDQTRAALPEVALRRESESMVTATSSTRPVTMNCHCTSMLNRPMPL